MSERVEVAGEIRRNGQKSDPDLLASQRLVSLVRGVSGHWNLLIVGLCLVLLFYQRPIAFLFTDQVNAKFAVYDLLHDDAFYYLTIAKSIVETSFSSFDGVILTNGYHPLWMLVLVGLGLLVPVDSLIYALILISIIPLFLAIGAFFFGQLTRRFVPGTISSVTVLVYFYAAFALSKGGMEVTLVFLFLPLFLLASVRLVERPGPRSAFVTALLAALLILSRLDSIILVALVSLLVVYYLPKQTIPSLLIPCVIGSVPLWIYLLHNYLGYGAFMPISGQAKAMQVTPFLISSTGMASLSEHLLRDHTVSPFFYATVIGVPLIIRLRMKRQSYPVDLLLVTVLAFPFTFFLLYLTRSDWPFWLWYFYPLAISFALSMMLLEKLLIDNWPLYRGKVQSILIKTVTYTVVLVTIIQFVFFTPRDYSPYPNTETAMDIAAFAESRPGIYAMGDLAGLVGFLLPYPLIQLEGLVADKRLLEMIGDERNLKEVLVLYNVDFYITARAVKVNGCWQVNEPWLPGESAPRMRAAFCTTPIFRHVNNNGGRASIFEVK